MDLSEFRTAIRKGGQIAASAVSDADLQHWFSAVDLDGSGTVSINELAVFVWGSDDKVDDFQSDGTHVANQSDKRTTKAVAMASSMLDDGPPSLSGSSCRPLADVGHDDGDDVFGSVPPATRDTVALSVVRGSVQDSVEPIGSENLSIPEVETELLVPSARVSRLSPPQTTAKPLPDKSEAFSEQFLVSQNDSATLRRARTSSLDDMFEMTVHGEVEAVRAFVRRGVHINTPDENGWIPLDWACHGGDSAEVVMVLVDGGAKIDNIGKDGDSPIHRVARRAHLPILNMLLRKGAHTDAKNDLNGRTALHSLVIGATRLPISSPSAYGDAAKMLLRAGAPLTATDNKGRTPRALACLRRQRATDYRIKHAINATINAIDHFVAGQRVHAKFKRTSTVQPSAFDQLIVKVEVTKTEGDAAAPTSNASSRPRPRETMLDVTQRTPTRIAATPARRSTVKSSASQSNSSTARTLAENSTDASVHEGIDTVFGLVHRAMQQRRAAGRRLPKLKESRQTFELIEGNGKTGVLSATDFRQGLVKLGLGLTDSQVSEVVAGLCANGEPRDAVDYNDFVVKVHSVAPSVAVRPPKTAPSVPVSGDSQSIASGMSERVRGRWRLASNATAAFGKKSRKPLAEERNIAEDDERQIEQLVVGSRRVQRGVQTTEARKVFLDLAEAVRRNRSLYGKVLRDHNTLFETMDKDSDGVLSVAEFGAALRRLGLGMNDEQTRTMMQNSSADGEERITHADFVRLVSQPQSRRGSRAGSVSSMTGPAAGTPPRHVRTNSNSMPLSRVNLQGLQEEDHSDVVLPVLQALIERLKEMNAIPTMDLFRAPGSFSELEVLHQQLVAVTAMVENSSEGALDPLNVLHSSNDVHTIAALLLRWVRESRGPLLPPQIYSECAALVRSSFVDGHEAAMAVRMFVAEQSESIARPLLLLTDFLRSGGPQHVQQLAELFTAALFRPVGAMGGVEDATEFTARLMGKVEHAAESVRLEEDDDPPSMPSGDDSQSVMSDETPPAMVSPSIVSPATDGTRTESVVSLPAPKRRRRSEPFGCGGCCGSRNTDHSASGSPRKRDKRKSAPAKMPSTDESFNGVAMPAAVRPRSFHVLPGGKDKELSPTRRHPSKPHSPKNTGHTPQPRQDAVDVKRVVFGSDQPLGLVLGSNDGTDAFIQGIGAYAAKRGLRPGMRILSLQGEDTRRLPLHQVRQMLATAGRPLVMDIGLLVDPAPHAPFSPHARSFP